jgi:hypothetical protein
MTTEFIQKNFPDFEKWSLSRRAREVVEAWPEVRLVSDEDFYAALKKVSAQLHPNADSRKWEENARLILVQLMSTGIARHGFDMTAKFSAALTDEELLAISQINPERIRAINLAIDSLRRE